jgi:hypothetical protein
VASWVAASRIAEAPGFIIHTDDGYSYIPRER